MSSLLNRCLQRLSRLAVVLGAAVAAVAMRSRVTGLPPEVLKIVYQRAQLRPVAKDDHLIAEQQKTADLDHCADVIKTRLDVSQSFDRQFPLSAQ